MCGLCFKASLQIFWPNSQWLDCIVGSVDPGFDSEEQYVNENNIQDYIS